MGCIPWSQWDGSPLPKQPRPWDNSHMEEESLIARNVRLRMEVKGLGPKALSLQAGLNETYVRDLLKGRSRNPKQAHLQQLAVALDCRASDLTGETEPATPGAMLTDEAISELVAAFRSTDEQGREMILRLAKAVRRDAEPIPEQPAPNTQPRPKGPEPPRPIPGGRVEENQDSGDCARVVRLPPVPVPVPARMRK